MQLYLERLYIQQKNWQIKDIRLIKYILGNCIFNLIYHLYSCIVKPIKEYKIKVSNKNLEVNKKSSIKIRIFFQMNNLSLVTWGNKKQKKNRKEMQRRISRHENKRN